MKNKLFALNGIIFVGLILLFIFLHLNNLNAPFERDEGHYAYGAWLWTKGLPPYLNTFEQKPPMIFYPYLLAVIINPNAYWPPRLIAAISLLLTIIILRMAVAREYGKRAAWISAWLALPMIMFPHLRPFAANTEKFLILPLVGTLAIYIFNRTKNSNWPWFWAGACGACAILYKQIAIGPVIYIFLFWLIENKQGTFRKLLYALGGGTVAFLLSSGCFLFYGALPAFWEQLVVFNKYYASSFGWTSYYLINHFQKFITSWPAVFVLLGWYVLKRPPRFWFYFGLFVVSLATIANTPYGHYYIMLMPFWAAITAVSLDSLISDLAKIFRYPQGQNTFVLFFTFLLLYSMIWPQLKFYTMPPLDLVAQLYGFYNPFVESPIVANQVKRHTKPDDYVFIAGTEQQILYYAKRRTPTRLGGMYGLMMNHPKALAYQRELIDDLEKRKPKVIVFVRSPLSWLRQEKSPKMIFEYLDRLLKNEYKLVGGCIRKKDIAYWEEPLKEENIPFCSMLLYRSLR